MNKLNPMRIPAVIRWTAVLLLLGYMAIWIVSTQHQSRQRMVMADEIVVSPESTVQIAFEAKRQPTRLALDGYCPVALLDQKKWIQGSTDRTSTNRGLEFRLSDENSVAKFREQPDRYTPALVGMDPVLYVDADHKMMGKREHALEHQGRIYLFASRQTLSRFFQSPARYHRTSTRPDGLRWKDVEEAGTEQTVSQLLAGVPSGTTANWYTTQPNHYAYNHWPQTGVTVVQPQQYPRVASVPATTVYSQSIAGATQQTFSGRQPQVATVGTPARRAVPAITPARRVSPEEKQIAEKIDELVRQYHSTDGQQRDELRDSLAAETEKHFDLLQRQREAEIQQIEKRLEKIRSIKEMREENRDSIVESQVKRLLGQPDPLAWDAGSAPIPNKPQPSPYGFYYGTPKTGTPVGLPGPPHVPLGEPAGTKPSDEKPSEFPDPVETP